MSGKVEDVDQLCRRSCPDVFLCRLTVAEDDQRGERCDAEASGCLGRVVDVYLADRQFLTKLIGDVFHDGCEEAAGGAPFGPEVDEDWDGRA